MTQVHDGPNGLQVIHDPEGRTLGDKLYVVRRQKCVPYGNALTLKALGGWLFTTGDRAWLVSFMDLYRSIGGKSTNTRISTFWSQVNYVRRRNSARARRDTRTGRILRR